MVTLRQAAQQALEALEIRCGTNAEERQPDGAITTLRAALAEQQEPAAWANPNDLQNFDMKVRTSGGPLHTVPLYTAPQPRREVELTDEEIQACGRDLFWPLDEDAPRFARAVIEAYKAKQGEQT